VYVRPNYFALESFAIELLPPYIATVADDKLSKHQTELQRFLTIHYNICFVVNCNVLLWVSIFPHFIPFLLFSGILKICKYSKIF